jgi:hypothetical protein
MRSVGLDEATTARYQRSSQEAARQRLQAMIADAGLIGSVADRLLRAAPCDVLVIPYRPAVLRLGAPTAVTSDRLSAAPVGRDVTTSAGLVPIQSRLQNHDGGNRRAHAHE